MIAKQCHSFSRGICVVAAIAITAATALATTYTWTPTAGGIYNWNNSGSQNNWGTGAGGAYPSTTGDVAYMVLNVTGPLTNNLNVAVTNGELDVRDTDANQKIFIAAGTAGSLTFGSTNGNNAVLKFGGSGTEGGNCPLITAPVMLNDPLSILTYNFGARLEITGKISSSGTKNITLSAAASGAKLTLKLDNAANDFTGDLYATGTVSVIGYGGDSTAAISYTSDGSLGNANNDLYLNGGQIYANSYGAITLGAGRKIDVGANGGFINLNSSGSDNLALAVAGQLSGSGPLFLTGSSMLTLSAANSGFSGPINVIMAYVSMLQVSAAGAAGSGPINVYNGRINYYAALGTSGRVTAKAGGGIVLNSSNFANDKFTIEPYGTIVGSGATANQSLASLDYSASNLLTLAENAVIANTASTNAGIKNVPNTAKCFYGLNASGSSSLTVGPGTPWKGVANAARVAPNWSGGTMTAAGDFTLLGINNDGWGDGLVLKGVALASSGGPYVATIAGTYSSTYDRRGYFLNNGTTSQAGQQPGPGEGPLWNLGFGFVQLNQASANYSGVSKFLIANGGILQPYLASALGTNNVPVEVGNGGLLQPNVTDALNGNVTVRDGGVIDINFAGGLTGSGTVTLDPGAVVRVRNGGGLTGAQLPASAIGAGRLVRLEADDITNLGAVDPAAIFEVVGTRTYTSSLTLDGRTMFGGGGATFANGSGALTIGAGGATIAAGTYTTFVINKGLSGSANITIGATNTYDSRTLKGMVRLDPTTTGGYSGKFTVSSNAMLRYNKSGITANAGSGVNADVNVQPYGQVTLGEGTPNITTTDTFNVPANGVIGGTYNSLAYLNTANNLAIAEDAIVARADTANGYSVRVTGLGTTPMYFFGVGWPAGNDGSSYGEQGTALSVGPGTPWKGISSTANERGGGFDDISSRCNLFASLRSDYKAIIKISPTDDSSATMDAVFQSVNGQTLYIGNGSNPGAIVITSPVANARQIDLQIKGNVLLNETSAGTDFSQVRSWNVASGARFGGAAAINDINVTGGTLAPGAAPSTDSYYVTQLTHINIVPGMFTARNVTLDSSSTFQVELNGTTAGVTYDQLTLSGTVNLGNSALAATVGYTPQVNDTYTIVANATSVAGKFGNLLKVGGVSYLVTPAGYFSVAYGSNSVTLQYTGTKEPKAPGTIINIR